MTAFERAEQGGHCVPGSDFRKEWCWEGQQFINCCGKEGKQDRAKSPGQMDQTPKFSNMDTNNSKGIFLGGETLLEHLETQGILPMEQKPSCLELGEGRGAGCRTCVYKLASADSDTQKEGLT